MIERSSNSSRADKPRAGNFGPSDEERALELQIVGKRASFFSPCKTQVSYLEPITDLRQDIEDISIYDNDCA